MDKGNNCEAHSSYFTNNSSLIFNACWYIRITKYITQAGRKIPDTRMPYATLHNKKQWNGKCIVLSEHVTTFTLRHKINSTVLSALVSV